MDSIQDLYIQEELELVAHNVTAAELLNVETMDMLFAIPNQFIRQTEFAKLMVRARELKIARSFDQLFKARQALEAEKQRHDSQLLDLVLPGMPVEGFVTPEAWQIDVQGMRRMKIVKGMPIIEVACKHPIIITDLLENMDSGNIKARVRWYKDGKWYTKVVPRAMLYNRTALRSLAAHGIDAHSESVKFMMQYFSDFEYANSAALSVKKSIGRLGWYGKGAFAPYGGDLEFDGDGNTELYNAVKTTGGKREEWLTAAKKAREDLRGRILLAASFAAPLIELADSSIFLLNLWGRSGTGKTVGLYLAESIWGNPVKTTQTFCNMTVSLERIAAFFHNLPLAFDELQMVKDNYKIVRFLYKLIGGKSRIRGSGNGSLETEISWANTIITNNERPLTDFAMDGSLRNRIIEIDVNNPLFGGGKNLISICDAVKGNYGHAGVEYIVGLISELKENPQTIHEMYKEYRSALTDREQKFAEGEQCTNKQIDIVACMAIADRLSSRFVFGIDKQTAKEEAEVFMWELLNTLRSAIVES